MNAVITGATRGIGRAIAERFAMAGFHLFLTARDATELKVVQAELEKKYKISVYTRAANFQKKSHVVLFAESVRKEAKTIDVLVNNVGQYLTGSLFDVNGDKLTEQLQVNLVSAHQVTAALAPVFKQQRRGHIFTIGSILSTRLREDAAFYTISKHALRTWHQLLLEEMRPYRVKTTFVMPSSTFTSSWDGSGVAGEELIQPETVAEAIFDCYNLGGESLVDEISLKTIKKKYD